MAVETDLNAGLIDNQKANKPEQNCINCLYAAKPVFMTPCCKCVLGLGSNNSFWKEQRFFRGDYGK